MQKLIDTLKSFGIEIPEDKQADVKKSLAICTFVCYSNEP